MNPASSLDQGRRVTTSSESVKTGSSAPVSLTSFEDWLCSPDHPRMMPSSAIPEPHAHAIDVPRSVPGMDAQVVLITGASRGFGAAAARAIAGRGHTVVATMRNPAGDAAAVTVGFEDGIHPARLD